METPATFKKSLFSRPAGVVVACTTGNAVSVTPMVYTVFGLFLIPIATEFDWSRAAVSFVLFIIAVAGAISYPIVGRLIDRYGARPVILTGNVLFAASVASVSLVEASRFQFYTAYALIGISAAIPSSVMFTKVIAGWFDRRRGLFLGIVGGLGNGIGAALSPLFVFALVSSYGWRAGFQGIGAVIILVGFPVLYLLLRDPPQDTIRSTREALEKTQGLTLAEALKTSTFWIILAAIALGAGCMTAILRPRGADVAGPGRAGRAGHYGAGDVLPGHRGAGRSAWATCLTAFPGRGSPRRST